MIPFDRMLLMAGHDGISGNDQSHMVFENGLRIINPFQAA